MELTYEQAVAMCRSRWWEGLDPRTAVLRQMSESYFIMPWMTLHEMLSKALDRPVFSHEILNLRGSLRKELLGDKPAPTIEEILALIPAERRILVGI